MFIVTTNFKNVQSIDIESFANKKKMDPFSVIKYVYNPQQNDNIEGKWALFGDVLKDNV